MINAKELRIGNYLNFLYKLENESSECFKKANPITAAIILNIEKLDNPSDFFEPIPLTPEILNKTELCYNEELDRWQKGDEMMLIVKRIDRTVTYRHIFGIEPPKASRYQWVVYWQLSALAEPVIVVPIIEYLHQLQSAHYVLWNWKELKVNL